MLFRSSPEKFWNLFAKKYAAAPIVDVAAYQKKIGKIQSYLSLDDVVLDVGCGTGTQVNDIANSVKHVTGIDISNKLLAIAETRKIERNIKNVKFVQTTVFDERFRPDSFNVVMAFYLLHFYEDIDRVVRHIYELLGQDGLFILETACLGEKNKITGTLVRLAGKIGLLPLVNLLTTHQIEQVLERAGFSIIEKIKFSSSVGEYTIFAKKIHG